MTICIAAICQGGKSVVLASDTEVGTGISSTNLPASKWGPLYSNWSIGIAGSVAMGSDVVGAAVAHEKEMTEFGLSDIRTALEACYRKTRMAKIEAEYLATRGWTLQEFKEHGTSKLPPTTFSNIDARMAVYDLGAEFIVAGYEEADGFPSIVTVANPGISVEHTRLGFWCIGSGATAAQMSMFARNYSYEMSTEEAAYYVLEAKISAEHASGVGSETTMYLKKPGKEPKIISQKTEDAIREIHGEIGLRPFSSDHQQKLESLPEFKVAESKRKSRR
jgi:20S proteasome alpha/beta subunit